MTGAIVVQRSPRLSLVVPDNPWSSIYKASQIRSMLGAQEEGLGDRVAWSRYVAHDEDEPEHVGNLYRADRVYGKKLRRPRARK